eukprot:scaffold127353_cov33-Phaeocystis_antarctica.AAC.2
MRRVTRQHTMYSTGANNDSRVASRRPCVGGSAGAARGQRGAARGQRRAALSIRRRAGQVAQQRRVSATPAPRWWRRRMGGPSGAASVPPQRRGRGVGAAAAPWARRRRMSRSSGAASVPPQRRGRGGGA